MKMIQESNHAQTQHRKNIIKIAQKANRTIANFKAAFSYNDTDMIYKLI